MRRPNNMSPIDTIHWYGWDEVLRVPELGECWEWRGPKHAAGYGNIRAKTADGRQTFVRAHRVMLAASGTEVPDGLHVLHACDNPPCIRPEHLRAGTDADNTADKMARGRHRVAPSIGEAHGRAKLTEADVQEVRRIYALGGVRQVDLGRKFGISQSAVSLIILGKKWSHLPDLPAAA